jgi:hypothetical protein
MASFPEDEFYLSESAVRDAIRVLVQRKWDRRRRSLS